MSRPTLVYDDDCGFCTWWAAFADRRGEFDLVGFSEIDPDLRERLPADYESRVHLVDDDGVHSGGEATELTLAHLSDGAGAVVEFLSLFPGYASLRDRAYRWVAARRSWWGRLASRDAV